MSSKIRIKYASLAEKEILRYSSDLILWFKHICNFELRAPQLIWMEEILAHDFVLLVAQPRLGKTMLMEMLNLYEAATTPFEDGRTWAPNVSQAQDSYSYQFSAINNSEILTAYIAWEKGKHQLSSMRYKFVNQSNWRIFGIQSDFEGINATIIRAEEYDDLDLERYENRVLGRGAAKNRNGKPTRIRLTGTIQESKGNMFTAEQSGMYYVCTKFPFNILLKMGYYDRKIIERAIENLTEEAVRRIFYLEYVAGRNFIWEEKLEECQAIAKAKNWEGIPFEPGGRYAPTGHVFCGFDCGHSGESSTASIWSFQIFESIGDMVLWLNGFNWVSTIDPIVLIDDIISYWHFYRIERGYGDALKSDLIAQINDALYEAHLIGTDRQRLPENKRSNWDEWDFSPKWNTGRAKYLWGGILKNKIERRKLILPKFGAKDGRKIAKAGRLLASRLLNVRENRQTKGAYPRIECINPKLGDDDFDASSMAVGCINDHGPRNIINFSDLEAVGHKTVTSGLLGDLRKNINWKQI